MPTKTSQPAKASKSKTSKVSKAGKTSKTSKTSETSKASEPKETKAPKKVKASEEQKVAEGPKAIRMVDLIKEEEGGKEEAKDERSSREIQLARQRAEYKNRKKIVALMEQNNTSRLIFFKSYGSGGFWKAIRRSAVYYSLFIGRKRLKREIKLNSDNDFYDRSPEGVVSVKNMKKVEDELRQFDIRRVPSDDQNIMIFDTGVKFSEADIKSLLKEDDNYRKQLNKLLVPSMAEPKIYTPLRLILNGILSKVRAIEVPLRDIAIERLFNPVYEATQIYLLAARGKGETLAALEGISEKLEEGITGLKILLDLNIWPARTMKEVAEKMSSTQVYVRAEIRKARKKLEEEAEE